MTREIVEDARGGATEGVVVAVNDTGQVQTVDVQTPGGLYAGVEVWQPFGHASSPPPNGAVAILIAIGGDPANLRAFIKAPQRRFGNLVRGESALYGSDGSRVHVRQGGTIEVIGAAAARMVVGSATLELAAGVVTITNADVIADGISLKNHTHSTPSGESGPPTG